MLQPDFPGRAVTIDIEHSCCACLRLGSKRFTWTNIEELVDHLAEVREA